MQHVDETGNHPVSTDNGKGLSVWFTGLSGAAASPVASASLCYGEKSTICNLVAENRRAAGMRAVFAGLMLAAGLMFVPRVREAVATEYVDVTVHHTYEHEGSG